MGAFNWRHPWAWAWPMKQALNVAAFCVGGLLAAPFYMTSFEDWTVACEAEDLLMSQRAQTQSWQMQIAQLTHTNTSALAPISHENLLSGAKQAGLSLSFLGLDPLIKSPALSATFIELRPVRLSVTGSASAWLDWLTLCALSVPGWTIDELALTVNSQGDVSAQLTLLAPQHLGQLELPANLPEGEELRDLSNRDPLEFFPSEKLHYVGHLAMGSGGGASKQMHALIRVKSVGSTVHRIKVGEHLGHHFGRVSAITTEHVLVEEWVFDGVGQWLKRELKLPLMTLAL